MNVINDIFADHLTMEGLSPNKEWFTSGTDVFHVKVLGYSGRTSKDVDETTSFTKK